MSRPKKDPLRQLTSSERRSLEQLARSQSAPSLSVARARALLAVNDGSSYTEAAQLVGQALGDSVAVWVARFNQVGLAAVERQAGGRPPTQYGPEERDRILAEFRRPPDRDMTESIQRILAGRALAGQTPANSAELIEWLESTACAWNADPTPFEWGGKRQLRRQRGYLRRHPLGGSGAGTRKPLRRRLQFMDQWRSSGQVTH